jgi:hypothetical protein
MDSNKKINKLFAAVKSCGGSIAAAIIAVAMAMLALFSPQAGCENGCSAEQQSPKGESLWHNSTTAASSQSAADSSTLVLEQLKGKSLKVDGLTKASKRR